MISGEKFALKGDLDDLGYNTTLWISQTFGSIEIRVVKPARKEGKGGKGLGMSCECSS